MPVQATLRVIVTGKVGDGGSPTGTKRLVFDIDPVLIVAGGPAITVTALWEDNQGVRTNLSSGEFLVGWWGTQIPNGLSSERLDNDKFIIKATEEVPVGTEVILSVEQRP